jgi:hypothetical protein
MGEPDPSIPRQPNKFIDPRPTVDYFTPQNVAPAVGQIAMRFWSDETKQQFLSRAAERGGVGTVVPGQNNTILLSSAVPNYDVGSLLFGYSDLILRDVTPHQGCQCASCRAIMDT